MYAGAKVGGYLKPAAKACPVGPFAPLPARLWLLAHCQAQYEQPSARLVLLWGKQGASNSMSSQLNNYHDTSSTRCMDWRCTDMGACACPVHLPLVD